MGEREIKTRAPALVPSDEEHSVARTLLRQLNSYAQLPVDAVRYELLPAGEHTMAFHVEQSANKTQQYITGGYRAELRFSLYYRIQPGDSGLARIEADEALDALGDYLTENLPDLGERCHAKSLAVSRRASLSGEWDNGDEDHALTLRLVYEVLP